VQPTSESSPSVPLAGVPRAVREIIATLTARGHAAYLVGGCVRDLLRGEGVGDFDVATSAAPETVLELLPRAIPIGLRHGTVMVPTRAGPADVTTFRAGPDIEADLAHRDFTINAMAYDPESEALLDPFGGQSDLAGRRLRAVGRAADRFREDPLRILRAARLAATLEFEIAPEIESEMAKARAGLRGVARERVRSELALMLLAPDAARGLALLRRTRIEADLAPGTAEDAVAVVGALPRELELRLGLAPVRQRGVDPAPAALPAPHRPARDPPAAPPPDRRRRESEARRRRPQAHQAPGAGEPRRPLHAAGDGARDQK
jgi:tRNA nucleotidyltransferase (CCA-adding enzyme)